MKNFRTAFAKKITDFAILAAIGDIEDDNTIICEKQLPNCLLRVGTYICISNANIKKCLKHLHI